MKKKQIEVPDLEFSIFKFEVWEINDDVIRFISKHGYVEYTYLKDKCRWSCFIFSRQDFPVVGRDEILEVFLNATICEDPYYVYMNHEGFRSIMNSVLGIVYNPIHARAKIKLKQ